MKINRWKLKRRLELSYQRELTRLLNKIYESANNVDPKEMLSMVRKIARSKSFKELSYKLAHNMVVKANTDNSRTWREAALEGMQGNKSYKLLQNELQGRLGGEMQSLIEYNAKMISTLPIDIADKITNHIKEEALKGRRAAGMEDEIRKMFPEKSAASAKLIARTETSKASTALTRTRAQSRNKNWYIWRTSKDGRVRSSHDHMDGVLVHWDDPPSPELLIGEKSVGKYNAGDIWNCRCFAQPVIFLDYITFPAKVYYGGRIVTMTRSQFEAVM